MAVFLLIGNPINDVANECNDYFNPVTGHQNVPSAKCVEEKEKKVKDALENFQVI